MIPNFSRYDYNKVRDEKVPLLLFSGGLDSTYYLWCLLNVTNVDIVYHTSDKNLGDLKMKAEAAAREAVIEYLSKTSPFKIRNISVVDHSTGMSVAKNTNFGQTVFVLGEAYNKISFSQVLFHLMAGLYAFDPAKNDSFHIGYVSGDCVLPYLPILQDAWKSLFRILKMSDEIAPLHFDMCAVSKELILESMPKELVDLTWTCETPHEKDGKIVPCGGCTPCETREKIDIYKRYKHGETLQRCGNPKIKEVDPKPKKRTKKLVLKSGEK